jgi:hypothetical protein
VYSCVQSSPFLKQPDPFGRREQAAALSEKQASLRSNVTASLRECSADRQHRGMECRAYLLAHGAAVTFWRVVFKSTPGQNGTRPPVHTLMPSRSWELDLCSCDLQRNIGHDGRLRVSRGQQTSSSMRPIICALREAGADLQLEAPLRMLARSFLGIFLSGGVRSIFLSSIDVVREVPQNSCQ